MKKYLYNQRGVALPTVLAIVLIVVILGFTAMSLTENQTLMINRKQKQEMALHYAEAGVHKYISLLNANNDFYNTTASDDLQNIDTAFESGFYSLTITKPNITNPMITIQSSGWCDGYADMKRTVQVNIYKRQFVQNMWVTNSEGDHIWWVRGDEVHGPLHTNGQLLIDGTTGDGSTGPTFEGTVTYSGADPEIISGTEEFMQGTPEKVNALLFPSTNSTLQTFAEEDGYSYTGRTCIYINGSNVTIRNANVSGGAAQTRSLPSNGVIYVDGGSGDKWLPETGNVFVSGQLDGRLTIAAAHNIYITAYDPTNWNEPNNSGVPKGTNTGGLTYAGGTDMTNCNDMLGLIANGSIYVLHYGWPQGSSPYYWYKTSGKKTSEYDVAPNNISIYAALFALQESFGFESHSSSTNKGTITIVGSLVQDTRGGIGLTDGTGYSKNYSHDARMLYDMPPHFLEPLNSGWEIRGWKETNI